MFGLRETRTGRATRAAARAGLRGAIALLAAMVIACLPVAAVAQQCPVTTNATGDIYPQKPLAYPMTSTRYAVQYKIGAGDWTDARVYMTTYGGATSSPYVKASQYPVDTSMSFVSIPATAGAAVQIRISKLWAPDFPAIKDVSLRPAAKGVHVDTVAGRTVQLSTTTAADFAGDQFILWWNGGASQGGGIEGLAFFLDPPYQRPAGPTVKTIATPADLTGDLSALDTLDFEGTVVVASTGAQAFVVPADISSVYLGPGAWLQGKLRFAESGAGETRRLYGPGVIDASRFGYMWRQCRNSTEHTDDGYPTLSFTPKVAGKAGPERRDKFVVDGVVLTDNDYYATDLIVGGTINNVKIIGWNGNNDGFALGEGTTASNVFVRTGDDSLKLWGAAVTVTNATVWQNWNGAPLNLGWAANSPGDDGLVDGLYVVRTDWRMPTTVGWNATTLAGQNNAIIASLMVPGTSFGAMHAPVYKNIYVEDAPRALFSLKILPPDCALVGQVKCPTVDPSTPSVLDLTIENVHTPASVEPNSIGFQNRTSGGAPFPGAMNIRLDNVVIAQPDGSTKVLSQANAASVGKIMTNGSNVTIA